MNGPADPSDVKHPGRTNVTKDSNHPEKWALFKRTIKNSYFLKGVKEFLYFWVASEFLVARVENLATNYMGKQMFLQVEKRSFLTVFGD